MQKNFLLKLAAPTLAAIMLSSAAGAKSLAKEQEYKAGTFTDVADTAWYAAEVKSAYELGLMNGQSDTTFGPDGSVTVAEGITMASRLHAIYNGKTISEKSGGEWYDMYVEYAKNNGLIEDGQFASYKRNIMRYEMAQMFAKTLPAEDFAAINEIKDIPDVAKTEEYYDELMMLYKAGVVMGSDDYGNFYATSAIKRSEAAAIINRVALPENRKTGTLEEYGERDQAVFLIDDYYMTRTVRQIQQLASGWRYEDMGSQWVNDDNTTSNSLSDNSTESRVAIHRDITVQTKGVIEVESVFTVSSNSGARIIFTDSEGKNLFELKLKDGKYIAVGNEEKVVSVEVGKTTKNKAVYFALDLDNKTAKLVIDGKDAGTYDMNKNAKDLARMSYATTDEDILVLSVQETHMYVNYTVNDMFRYSVVGEKPYGWTSTDNVTIGEMNSDKDLNSVKISGKGSSYKKFSSVENQFVFETFVLPTKNANAYVAIKNGDKTVLKVDIDKGGFYVNGEKARSYDERCWHLIRVEGDTETGKAIVKINNKKCLEVKLDDKAFDTAEVVNNGTDDLWFDDVEVYNTYEYADYVPTPVPVTDDEWLVGMSICSLWREGTHYGWDCVSPYDEITPVLGYYDEGLPEVADWEIKFLVEHGFDFQHFCWYASSLSDPFKESYLEDAIVDGYMNAKYSYMQKIMIMWENNGFTMSDDSKFYDVIWPYWCEWYFSDDRYLTIDNKPLLTIYNYAQFVTSFGGEANAKKAISFMNEDIKRYGYDGMIVLGCGTFQSKSKSDMEKMKNVGVDALVSYTFGELAYDPEYQKTQMMNAYNRGGLSLMPCIGVGFNDIGWTETRTPLITPENMKSLLNWAKDEYMPLIAKNEKEDWISKFVFHTTWNEYGEGHYIMPTNLHGFGYIDANRAVFSSVAGTDDSKHFDVVPTDNQKARLGYLYPAKNVPMKKTQYIDDTQNLADNIPVITWDFEDEATSKKWTSQMNVTGLKYDASEKAYVGKTTTTDGAISTLDTGENFFEADNARYLHVCIKYDAGCSAKFDMYFKHDLKDDWSASKGVFSGAIVGDGEYHDYYIDMSTNNYWNGTIKDLRFDPLSVVGNFYIKKIEFLTEQGNGSFAVSVDGVERYFSSLFAEQIGDEIFVAGNPSLGFYSLLNTYIEYNRINGTLDIYADNGSVIKLTVGSNKAVVDGKEVTLAKAVETVDGLVTVPLKLVCNTFGYKFELKDNAVAITVRENSYDHIIESRIENQFEFEVPGDLEGWKIGAAKGNSLGGLVMMTATPATSTRTGYDPTFTNNSVRINSKYYNQIQIRYRATFDDPEAEQSSESNISVYFATDAEMGLDEKKSFKYKIADMQVDDEGFYTFTIDCKTNEKWDGTINTLRFDPANLGGFYEIDYIRVLADPEAEALLKAEQEKEAKEKELLYAVDDGAPFYIVNADAEDVNDTTNLKAGGTPGSTKVTIVEDDLREGNHAYLLTPDTSKQTWTYFRAKTRFKAGATYTVEFDMRIVKDHKGNDVASATSNANPRYTDMVNGELKSVADHAVAIDPLSSGTADGWVRRTTTFTINDELDVRDNDEFSIFINPTINGNDFTNYSVMIDNIVVKVAE